MECVNLAIANDKHFGILKINDFIVLEAVGDPFYASASFANSFSASFVNSFFEQVK